MPNPDGYSSPVDFRITQNPQSVGDQKSRYNFEELYDFAKQVILTFVRYLGVGTYDQSLWPDLSLDPGQLLLSGNLNKAYIQANNNITKGMYVVLFNSAGTLVAGISLATGLNRQADGFCNADVAIGDVGEFILHRGINPWLTGLTIGQRYWLSLTVPGGVQTTPPVAAGNIEQYIGQAVTTTELDTNIMYPIQH